MTLANNPLNHPAAHQIPENDVEKRGELNDKDADINESSFTGSNSEDNTTHTSHSSLGPHDIPPTPVVLRGRLKRWNDKIEGFAGLEARGITRVLPEEKHDISLMGYAQMCILWFSVNVTVNNLAVGFLGPLAFNLGWVDSVLLTVFGCALGSVPTSYTSTWGAESGNRTLIVARYVMGYWPAKLIAILNAILMVGYGVISCIIAGQMLSAVNGGHMTIIVGIIIAALIIGVVAIFGMAVLHVYERWAFIPQVIALFVLIGAAGPHFNTALQSSAPVTGTAGEITANRLSFFALQYSVPVGWAAAGSDFYVYYPTHTSKRLTFLMTWLGLASSFIFVNIIGVGLGCGVAITPAWQTAYATSSGALLLAGYGGLGGFGGFCTVILALSAIQNNIPGTYAAAIDMQILGRHFKAVPRWLWVVAVVIVEFVCGVAGRDHLFDIFENFLALMGYWISIFVTIMLEEHVLFRRLRGVPFDWSAWEDRKRLPLGVAALVAFLIGWAGAIIGMYQAWYAGPVAKHVGGYGGDIGTWIAIAFTCVTFPPMRWLELKLVGR